jgi:hypothetical protein
VSTPNILARKSEGGLLPYCKIGAKSEGNNRPGPLVSALFLWNQLTALSEGCLYNITN